MNRFLASQLFFCANYLCAPSTAVAVTIATVPVGNVGNPNDPLTGNKYGGVDYFYRISATEVTNDQYVEFLSAKAKSDPLELFDPLMSNYGGIRRSGPSGNYSYSAMLSMGNKPVIWVGWYDAIRFANWLHNGKRDGDTETGAYTLLGNTPIPSEGWNIARNPVAKWFLPSENEWYKAAYYQPFESGGDVDNYWLYATRSNDQPIIASAINTVGPNRGDIANPGENVVNYFDGADWNGRDGNLTTVGSAGLLSQSFYGTFDQSGNVSEWTETLSAKAGVIGTRFVLGGDFNVNYGALRSSIRWDRGARYGDLFIGFRVATIVPEPNGAALACVACALLLGIKKLRRKLSIRSLPEE